MNRFLILFITISLIYSCSSVKKNEEQKNESRPNIVIIYVDDLGYGDIGVNGAVGVETPNIDKLAENGLNFTDAHSSSSTCTPSRYSLLTGSYAFRNNAAVLPGDAPLIINPDKGTLPSMLKNTGYSTAVVGKWHLGLGMGEVDWNKDIKPGPREVGFEYSFLIPATGDRVPCVYLENQNVVNGDPEDPIKVSYDTRLDDYPVGTEHPELLKVQADLTHSNTIINGISRIGFMSGGEDALWVDEEFPFILTDKAKEFITNNQDQPFFLYFSFHDIHVPRIPNEKFVGKSTMGPRGDAIAQMDWCTGQLVAHLENLGLAENTLIIFSSDNGPILNDGYADQSVELLGEHNPAGPFRGAKYSVFEAGTRMPTITYWPGTIEPGVSSALLSQVDLYASLANLVNEEVKQDDAPDSEDHLEAWLGKTQRGREIMIEEAFTFGLRKGKWKYIAPFDRNIPQWLIDKKVESGMVPEPLLYNLEEDIGETKNIAEEHPEMVEELDELLNNIMNK